MISVYIFLVSLTDYLVDGCSTPTGVETPDVIDLRKQQRKEPDRPLYQVIIFFPPHCHFFGGELDDLTLLMFCMKVLEEKEERVAPGTLLAPSHTYVNGTKFYLVDIFLHSVFLIFHSELCSDTQVCD